MHGWEVHSPLDEKSHGKSQSPAARTGRAAGSEVRGVGCFFFGASLSFTSYNP